MDRHFCLGCSKVKYEDEFYPTNKSRCKLCLRAYNRERYQEKAAEKKLREQSCMGCGVVMRNPKSKVCQKCACKTDKFDIKTASDYSLKGGPIARGLAFLDACGNGVLQDFLDKCFTATDAFIEEINREPMTHVNDVDPYAIEVYEEHEAKYFDSRLMKQPLRKFQKFKKEN